MKYKDILNMRTNPTHINFSNRINHDKIKNKDNDIYKIHHDGSHYVGMLVVNNNKKSCKNTLIYDRDKQAVFNGLYNSGKTQQLKKEDLFDYILNNMQKFYPNYDYDNLIEYISGRIKAKEHNLYKQKKLFRRKANLHMWNFLFTCTLDERIHTEESFRKKFRRTLSNLSNRRKWRYIGVFEYAPETRRLHFHALLFIPDNESIGTFQIYKDYDKKNHRVQERNENSFFRKNYGINDFKKIESCRDDKKKTLEYILKYIEKDGEPIVYSRHIPSIVVKIVRVCDIACTMFDYVSKFVFFDDVIDYFKDVGKFEPKQLTMTGLCYDKIS